MNDELYTNRFRLTTLSGGEKRSCGVEKKRSGGGKGERDGGEWVALYVDSKVVQSTHFVHSNPGAQSYNTLIGRRDFLGR